MAKADDGPDFPDAHPDTSFDMYYDSSNNEVVFEVTTESSYYFGLGFGTSVMGTGNDMIMCTSSSGTPTCTDMHSNGYSAPIADSTDDLTVSGSVSGSQNVYEIRRALDTGDTDNDYVFALDTEFDMIWALAVNTNDISVSHDYRGANKATLYSDGSYSFADDHDDVPDAATPGSLVTSFALASLVAAFTIF